MRRMPGLHHISVVCACAASRPPGPRLHQQREQPLGARKSLLKSELSG
jgi:hypothetical protein